MKKIINTGFTLLEIMFITILVGLAVGLIIWLFSMSNIGKTEDAKVTRVIDVYRQIDDASSYYMAKYGVVPSKEDLLRTGILKSWPEVADELVFNPTCLAKITNPKEYLLVFEDLVGGPEYDLLGFIPCVEYEYALLYNNSAFHLLNVSMSPFSPTIAFAADEVSLETIENIQSTRDEADKAWKTKAFDLEKDIYGVVYTIENDVCKTKEECKALLSPQDLVTLDPDKETSTWLKKNKGESTEPDFGPIVNPSGDYVWKLHDDIFTPCSQACNGVKVFPYVCTKVATEEPVSSGFCPEEQPAAHQEACNTQASCYYWQENAIVSLCENGQLESMAACTDMNTLATVEDNLCTGTKPESVVSACDKDFGRQCFYVRNNTRVGMTGTKYNFYVGTTNPISPYLSVTNYALSTYENDNYIYEQGDLAEPLQWNICITPKEGKAGWQYSKWGLCDANSFGTQKKTLVCVKDGKQTSDSFCGTKPSVPSEITRSCLSNNPPSLLTDTESQGSVVRLTINLVPSEMASAPLSAFSPSKQVFQARLNMDYNIAINPDSDSGFSSDYFIKVSAWKGSVFYVPDLQSEVSRSYGSGSGTLTITYKAKKLNPTSLYPEGSTYWSSGQWSPCMGCGMSERSREIVCRDSDGVKIDEMFCDSLDKPIEKEVCDTGMTCNGFNANCYSVDPSVFTSIPSAYQKSASDTALYLAGKGYSTYYGSLINEKDGLITKIAGGGYRAANIAGDEVLERLRTGIGGADKMTFLLNPDYRPGTTDEISRPMSVRSKIEDFLLSITPQYGVEFNFVNMGNGEYAVAFPGKKVATRTYTDKWGNGMEYSFYELCTKKVGTIIYEDTAQGYSDRCGFVPFKGLNVYSCKIADSLPYIEDKQSTWVGSQYDYDDFQEIPFYYTYNHNSGDFEFCGIDSQDYPATNTQYTPEPCQSGQVVTGKGCMYCPYGAVRNDPPKQQRGGVWYFPQARYCYKDASQSLDKVVQCEYWDGETSQPYYSGDSWYTNHWFLREWSITIP